MNTVGFFTIRFNNFKGNSSNLNKKNKISNLKINIIMNNTAKIRGDDNSDFLNNKNNLRRGNKRGGRFYNKNNNNKNKKIQIAKLDKYYKEKEKFKFKFF